MGVRKKVQCPIDLRTLLVPQESRTAIHQYAQASYDQKVQSLVEKHAAFEPFASTAWKQDIQEDWGLKQILDHAGSTLLGTDERVAKKMYTEMQQLRCSARELAMEFPLKPTQELVVGI